MRCAKGASQEICHRPCRADKEIIGIGADPLGANVYPKRINMYTFQMTVGQKQSNHMTAFVP